MHQVAKRQIPTFVFNPKISNGCAAAGFKRQLTIETICRDNLTGRSQLQKIFRNAHGCGVIDFFTRMKIDAARQLIRNNQLNFTEIADRLGYNSVHYFSRQFKKLTGMTPSEYAVSIRSLSEKQPEEP